jgi:predicted DNA repair protein MutK
VLSGDEEGFMAGGLVGLLDDVAALAKLAAASIDDVGAAAGRASVKAAGVVVDDTAVTPTYVQGLAAERELPIIKKIATGSLRNKLLFILPVALLLSEIAPTVVEVILMAGGVYLCYEGAHKIVHALKHDDQDHEVPATLQGPEVERTTISGAIRTDFILSAEIMVISLKEVIDETLLSRAVILVVVAVLITLVVYGLVAAIVKMDDVGLSLTQRRSDGAQRVGRGAGDRHAGPAPLAVADRHGGDALGRWPHPARRDRRARVARALRHRPRPGGARARHRPGRRRAGVAGQHRCLCAHRHRGGAPRRRGRRQHRRQEAERVPRMTLRRRAPARLTVR